MMRRAMETFTLATQQKKTYKCSHILHILSLTLSSPIYIYMVEHHYLLFEVYVISLLLLIFGLLLPFDFSFCQHQITCSFVSFHSFCFYVSVLGELV